MKYQEARILCRLKEGTDAKALAKRYRLKLLDHQNGIAHLEVPISREQEWIETLCYDAAVESALREETK